MSARFVLLLAGLLAFAPASAQALELKNIRPSYGPLGATRSDAKLLPGDYLFINYEIDGLKVDANNKANFVTLVEVFDDKNKAVFSKETPSTLIPQLGGTSMPGDLHVIMGTDRPPGQYKVRLTVKDAIAKEEKSFIRQFELLGRGFGIVGAYAPAISFLGHPYMVHFNVVDLALGANKKVSAKVDIKILDEAGRPTTTPMTYNYPADLPDGFDPQKANFVPVDYPIFPNRTGRFTIDVVATDLTTGKMSSFRYPLNVLDLAAISGK